MVNEKKQLSNTKKQKQTIKSNGLDNHTHKVNQNLKQISRYS